MVLPNFIIQRHLFHMMFAVYNIPSSCQMHGQIRSNEPKVTVADDFYEKPITSHHGLQGMCDVRVRSPESATGSKRKKETVRDCGKVGLGFRLCIITG